MSSFVVDKREYTKAAGFLAAVTETKNYYQKPVMYLWNKSQHRPYTADDVLQDFARLYTINAAAVAAQYGDAEPEADPADHRDVFAAAKARGADLMRKGYTLGQQQATYDLRRAVYGCIMFFRSAMYQIEGDEYERRALRILNKYFRGLYAVLQKLDGLVEDDFRSWGSFDALDPDGEV